MHYQFFKAYFLPFLFGIYDNLISDYVPGLQKYDMCMTEQVPGPQGVKIVGRHIASAPYSQNMSLRDFKTLLGAQQMWSIG